MKVKEKMEWLWMLVPIIALSVVVAFFSFLPGIMMWYQSIWEYKVKDFDTYQSDFQTVADLAYREFNKGQVKDSYIAVDEYPDGTVHLSYENVNTEDFVEVTMSQEEKQSLEKIVAKSFRRGDQAFLYVIRVYKNQVEFEIANGQYSLIYRTDGHKPKYTYTDGYFKLKKISDHWYHAKFVEN